MTMIYYKIKEKKMNQSEKRIYLIKELLSESSQYRDVEIPADEKEQKNMLRAFMNIREPKPISKEFLDIQDEYLQKENEMAGITDIDDLVPIKSDSRIYLWQGDMTTLRIEAIVNPANCRLCGCFQPLHNCADNIIHSKSGIQLRLKCNDIMQKQGYAEPTGKAKITPAYNLPCDYVLHTVGPIVDGKLTKEHEELLASCYRSCLELAEQSGVESIAFCCISTGVFMFPNDRAAEIAVKTVKDYLKDHDGIKKVVFNVFKDIDLEIYDRLLN
jgi:O-acetyl-ADP-ribose deacetylase (regulator of RNase III)